MNAMCTFMYLFVVYFSFAPIISANIHRYVNNFDIQVLMMVTETEMLTSTLHQLFGLCLFCYLHIYIYLCCGVSHFFLCFFLFFFLSGYILRSFFVLWFLSLSINEQNSDAFLIFFWRHFNLLIRAGLGRTVDSLHHRHVCLLQDLLSTDLCDFPLCRLDLPADSYHVGFLANRHSAFK